MILIQKQQQLLTVGRDTEIESPVLMILLFCCSAHTYDHYREDDGPLTPPSETSSPFSPGERRDSNDSQDVSQSGRQQSSGKAKRLGKDEKLARAEDITLFISVDEIINLPMGRFVKIIAEFDQ